MSAPIRGECVPAESSFPAFPPRPSTAIPGSGKSQFNDFLKSHLKTESASDRVEADETGDSEDQPRSEKKEDKEQIQPWTLLGIAPLNLMVPFVEADSITGTHATGSTAVPPELPGLDVPAQSQTAGEEPPVADASSVPVRNSLLNALAAAQEQKIPTTQLKDAPTEEQIAGKAVKEPQAPNGIPAAKQLSMLLNTAKIEEATSAPEQQRHALALASFDSASFDKAISLVKPLEAFNTAADRDSSADSTQLSVHFLSNSVRPEGATPSFEIAQAQGPSAIDKATMVDSLRDHVQLLRASSHDRVEVMLRPDAQTQLVVQVVKVDGQIEVRARCERGDFQLLDSHWDAVRHSLETQGVRVEPLLASNQHFTSDFNRQQDRTPRFHREGEEQTASIRSKTTSTSVLSNQTPVNAVPRSRGTRGWQTWA
jgi:hypothetical protein